MTTSQEVPPAVLLEGDGFDLIWHESGGKTFKASRRTHAHMWETQRRLSIHRPGAWWRTIQGAYNTDVGASEGTHDFDAVVDGEIVGWDDWYAEQAFLRSCGWADWVRTPAQGFPWHHHMVSLGYTTRVGIYVPGQVDDYYRHALGLKDHHQTGSDDTWHPANINDTVFSYVEWRANQEDNMPLNDNDKAFIRDAVRDAANKAVSDLLDTEVDPQVTVRVALKRAGGTPDLVRRARDAILAKFPKV